MGPPLSRTSGGAGALRRQERDRPPAPAEGRLVWTAWSLGSKRRPCSRQPEATWGRVERAGGWEATAGWAGGTSMPGGWGGGHSRPGQAAGADEQGEGEAAACSVREWVCWQSPCPLPFLPCMAGGGGRGRSLQLRNYISQTPLARSDQVSKFWPMRSEQLLQGLPESSLKEAVAPLSRLLPRTWV